jgi:hypothetical protein
MPTAIDNVIDPQRVAPKIYPSFGRCIYCLEVFPPDELTDEHIIPLQLEGGWVIEKACCEPCRKMSNTFEHKAMYADLLVPRIILRLKRSRRKSAPPSLPPAILHPPEHPKEFALEKETILSVEQYPPILEIVGLQRAGILAGVERDGSLSNFRIYSAHTGKTWTPPAPGIATKHLRDHTALALTVLKIAYCFAVAELGLDAFDTGPARALLRSERDDIYNFVGMEPAQQILKRKHLHFLSLKRIKQRVVVHVYLFGGYGIPAYEVVLH